MAVIGEPPRPQALFLGFSEDDPGFQAMTRLVATARRPDDFKQPLAGLRDAEWDIVVARRSDLWQIPGHMHVLAFGCPQLGLVRAGRAATNVTYRGRQPSAILHTPETWLGDQLRRLVTGDLIPAIQALETRPYLTVGTYPGVHPLRPEADHVPFVTDPDGHLVAGALPRAGGSGWCWALPHVSDRPELWLAAALEDWHERTPDRIPALPGWRTRSAWATANEQTARAALTTLYAQRDRVMAELASQEAALLATVAAATADADRGVRQLLTGQSERLVDAVAGALRALGFEVVDVDATSLPPGTSKVEDLQVLDPVDPAWTNITEVKGYTGGAKTSDFQRLARYARLYERQTGSPPRSRWYVVNQFLNADPDTRQPVLPGAEEDIASFAEDGGLVIDTRELFRLLRLVEDRAVTSELARARLRQAAGALRLSPPVRDSAPAVQEGEEGE